MSSSTFSNTNNTLAPLGAYAYLNEQPDRSRRVCSDCRSQRPLKDVRARCTQLTKRRYGVMPLSLAWSPDLAAWIGLTPKEHSTGGKQRWVVSAVPAMNGCADCW